MTEPIFDHDRLDVYRLSIEYVASSLAVAKDPNSCHRHARDQWLRDAEYEYEYEHEYEYRDAE